MKRTFLAVLSLFSFISCKPDMEWPSEWTSDMKFSMYYYGGMNPESWEILITKDSCRYKKRSGPNEQTYDFRLEQKELDALMHILQENNVHKMKMKEHAVIYDKATSGFTFSHGEKEFRISPSATESLEEKWWSDFKTIQQYANTIAWNKLNQQRKEFVFTIDPSVRKANLNFYISFDYGEKSFQFDKDSIPSETKTRLLPGTYEVQMYLLDESKQGQETYYASWMETLNTTGKIGATIKLVDRKLMME